jgi:CheY-like chemotaxis protein
VAAKTVLMVDGRKVVRTMVTRHLARYACRVIEASDAVEASDAIQAQQPDLIVLDSALLAPLQADERYAAIPMVVLVSHVHAAEREPARASAGRLLTPFRAQTFDREMSRFLGTPSGSAS